MYKDNNDEAKKGRRGKDITGAAEYHVIQAWEKAIEFKYRSFLDCVGGVFSPETWNKWKIRILRNWDETNKLFLQCIVKLQKGEILYKMGTPFVSYF